MAGMRWKCAKCYDYDLCTPCYMSGKHIAEHAFVRFDSVGNRYVCVCVCVFSWASYAIYDVCTILFLGGPQQACYNYTLFVEEFEY